MHESLFVHTGFIAQKKHIAHSPEHTQSTYIDLCWMSLEKDLD